ncbi:MAG TPA: hypothetical protein VLC53_02965, partial [Myxococcota bacterium]|nr:hypothetical protein [Myxococcota bacterium]
MLDEVGGYVLEAARHVVADVPLLAAAGTDALGFGHLDPVDATLGAARVPAALAALAAAGARLLRPLLALDVLLELRFLDRIVGSLRRLRLELLQILGEQRQLLGRDPLRACADGLPLHGEHHALEPVLVLHHRRHGRGEALERLLRAPCGQQLPRSLARLPHGRRLCRGLTRRRRGTKTLLRLHRATRAASHSQIEKCSRTS